MKSAHMQLCHLGLLSLCGLTGQKSGIGALELISAVKKAHKKTAHGMGSPNLPP